MEWKFSEPTLVPPMGGVRRLKIDIRGNPGPDELKSEQDAQKALNQANSDLRTAQQNLGKLDDAEANVKNAKTQAARQEAQKKRDDLIDQFGNRSVLEARRTEATAAINAKKTELDRAHSQIVTTWLHSSGLKNLTRFPPVISVNGKALEMPYYAIEMEDYWSLEADLPDSFLVNGVGVAKVSWPFFPAELWTKSVNLHDPDQAFPVTRVSQKSILISRIDHFSFVDGPEVPRQGSKCWHLIAGDNEIALQTSTCDPTKETPVASDAVPPLGKPVTLPSQANTPASGQKNAARAASSHDKQGDQAPPLVPLPPPSDYVVTATLASLPDKVILVAPSGSTYTLTIPDLKAKTTTVQPLALKQFDSLWVEIKAADLSSGSDTAPGGAGPDLSTVTLVEANGKPLNSIAQTGSTTASDGAASNQKPKVTSIKIEITRDLTAKAGRVDIGFHAGAKLIGTRQIQIARTEWASQGEK
jgi:hypothetical protein